MGRKIFSVYTLYIHICPTLKQPIPGRNQHVNSKHPLTANTSTNVLILCPKGPLVASLLSSKDPAQTARHSVSPVKPFPLMLLFSQGVSMLSQAWSWVGSFTPKSCPPPSPILEQSWRCDFIFDPIFSSTASLQPCSCLIWDPAQGRCSLLVPTSATQPYRMSWRIVFWEAQM